MKKSYDDDFYLKNQNVLKWSSARTIASLIMAWIKPRSVLDVGCGPGVWLSAFKENGVKDLQGIDGEWLNEELLQVDKSQFKRVDLEKPFQLEGIYDLVLSLEVAEHLSEERAKGFVEDLTNHGPIILFSAAIPLQGGVNHINEQWQSSWVNLFEKEGYTVLDLIRPKVWNDDEVFSYYAQNTFIFIKKEEISKHPALQKARGEINPLPPDIVHPRHYMMRRAQ